MEIRNTRNPNYPTRNFRVTRTPSHSARRQRPWAARWHTGGELLLLRLLTGKLPPLFSFPSMRFLELNSNKFGAAPAGSSCSRGRAACTGAPDVLLRIRLDPSLREAPLGKRFLHDRINQRTRLSPLDTTACTSPDSARTHKSIGLNKNAQWKDLFKDLLRWKRILQKGPSTAQVCVALPPSSAWMWLVRAQCFLPAAVDAC